jgi:hypothetical protein
MAGRQTSGGFQDGRRYHELAADYPAQSRRSSAVYRPDSRRNAGAPAQLVPGQFSLAGRGSMTALPRSIENKRRARGR